MNIVGIKVKDIKEDTEIGISGSLVRVVGVDGDFSKKSAIVVYRVGNVLVNIGETLDDGCNTVSVLYIHEDGEHDVEFIMDTGARIGAGYTIQSAIMLDVFNEENNMLNNSEEIDNGWYVISQNEKSGHIWLRANMKLRNVDSVISDAFGLTGNDLPSYKLNLVREKNNV